MNSFFTDVQTKMITQFGMTDKVSIYNDTIQSTIGQELLINANILIMNNVFQFFTKNDNNVMMDVESVWKMIRTLFCKSGSIIVTVPSLDEMKNEMKSAGIDLEKWVEKLEVEIDFENFSEEDAEGLANIHFYKVK